MAKIKGNASNNTLRGTALADSIFGFGGEDTLFGLSGADALRGGTGDDRLYGGLGDDKLFGEAGDDRLFGGLGKDALSGGNGKDALNGGAGDDTLEGGNEADTFNGGAGSDFASYQHAGSGISASLITNTGNSGEASGDTYAGIENLRGSNFSDSGGLFGNAASNIIEGLGGDDVIVGNGGSDKLYGGGGSDSLTGGSGKDTLDGGRGTDTINCANDAAQDRVVLHIDAADTVLNFDFQDQNRVVLSASETGIAALTPGTNFFLSTGAPANTDGAAGTPVIINDIKFDNIYFDKDGAGGAAPVLIGLFQTTQFFVSTDFEFIA